MLAVNYPTTRPDEEDQLLLGRYRYESEIFRGTYSRVFCMKDITSERQFSCKRFSLTTLTDQQAELICREADLAQKSTFPGEMKYISSILDKRSGTLFALVDLHKYGDLRTQLDTAIMEDFFFAEDTIWMIATQLLKFLADYSSQTATKDKILLDLRPSCIYVSEAGFVLVDTVRLARFDLFPDSSDYEMPCYNAPELLAGTRPFHTMDIWSLGATLFELCMRRPYITGWTRQQVLELGLKTPDITTEMTANPLNPRLRYSRKLSDFIADLLNPRPERRPSTDDLMTRPPIAKLMDVYKELLRIHYYKRGPRVARISTCACGGNMDDCCGYRRYLKKLAADPPYPRNVSYTYTSHLSGNTYTINNKWAFRQGKEHHRRYMLSETFAEPRTRPLGAKRLVNHSHSSNQPSVFDDITMVFQGSSTTSFSSTSSVSLIGQQAEQASISSTRTQEAIVDSEAEALCQPVVQNQCLCDQGVGTPSPVTLQDIITNVSSLELIKNKSVSPDTHRFLSPQYTHSDARKHTQSPQHNSMHNSPNFLKQSVVAAPLQSHNMRIAYTDVQLTNTYENRPNRFREQPSSMHVSSLHSETL
ncbi:Serine/threonine protein kinase [Giardia duodenalis]|uniref:Kinase, NEK n=2 Tax=Giardia intestinalis TaxID=5741 RepID=C6LWB4_GIAIB|nr:Kinase, NEK [Giardia intestinalis ATCC 50581]ESU43927.1 Serine/threonine protein kinase [Giardia intestinalis]